LRGFVHKLARSGTDVYFAGARPAVRRTLETTGFDDSTVHYTATAAAALEQIKSSPRTDS
jgi:anti-anti-sigma regulatory factor